MCMAAGLRAAICCGWFMARLRFGTWGHVRLDGEVHGVLVRVHAGRGGHGTGRGAMTGAGRGYHGSGVVGGMGMMGANGSGGGAVGYGGDAVGLTQYGRGAAGSAGGQLGGSRVDLGGVRTGWGC